MSIKEAIADYNKNCDHPYNPDATEAEAKDQAPADHPLGLPDGCPSDIAGIKAAMKEKGVVFHHLAKKKKLVQIYREEVLKEPETK